MILTPLTFGKPGAFEGGKGILGRKDRDHAAGQTGVGAARPANLTLPTVHPRRPSFHVPVRTGLQTVPVVKVQVVPAHFTPVCRVPLALRDSASAREAPQQQ